MHINQARGDLRVRKGDEEQGREEVYRSKSMLSHERRHQGRKTFAKDKAIGPLPARISGGINGG